MRFELILEPRADVPNMPDYIQNTTVTGRRLIGRLKESNITPAIQWARVAQGKEHHRRILRRPCFIRGCLPQSGRT